MLAPSRKAAMGNDPGWRCRNRLQGTGSPQLRSLCTAGVGGRRQTHWGQQPTLLAGMGFIRGRGLQGESLGGLGWAWREWGGHPEGGWGALGMQGRCEGEKRKGLGWRGHWGTHGGGRRGGPRGQAG